MTLTDLYEQLCQNGAFHGIDRRDFLLLLRNLKEKALIDQMTSGEVILAPGGEQIVEDRSFYASFVTPVEYTVECAGERIGVLPSDSIPLPHEAILLAGRRWRVEAIYHDQRQVIVVPAQGKTPPRFTGTGGQIDPKVMQKMREILAGDETYSYLSPKAIELLGAARTVFARTGLAVSDILSTGTETVWFPWAGTRAHEALSVLAAADRLEIKKDLISLTYCNCPPQQFADHCARVASGEVTLATLKPGAVQMERERFDPYVPAALLGKAFAAEWLDLEAARELAQAKARQPSVL